MLIKKIWILTFIVLNCKAVILLKYGNSPQVLEIASVYLPQNPNIIEAGSYNGSDTRLMAQRWPQGKIYTFEPVPGFFNLTKKNMSSYPQVNCYNFALGSKSGEMLFYEAIGVANGNPWPSGSFLKPKEHLNCCNYVGFKDPVLLPVRTLEEWANQEKVETVDFLWLDSQGTELSILRGMGNLFKTIKVVYIEVNFVESYEGAPLYDDVKQFLEKNGFTLIGQDFTQKEIQNGTRWFGNILMAR